MAESAVKAPECKERVALELAQLIKQAETNATGDKSERRDRTYWLKLYFECYEVVVHGRDPEE